MPELTARDFRTLRFLLSAPKLSALPPANRPEIAFAGRSNAGKSSALNTLCEQGNLARTSKTPGRTQAINFFANERLRFADLPGYGFARVPPAIKAQWAALIEGYLAQRETLSGIVLIMDARRPLLDFDRQLIAWGGAYGLAFHLLLTKADKLSRNEQHKALRTTRAAVEGATAQLFSATKRIGVDEARTAISTLLAGDLEDPAEPTPD
ncbi:ribosome biogenesis GTP-binding protein YihA/YsxC [Salinisphaera sp.]|uniref:ribosome biogenesis GTP-binding protein YihA/YsxC n=1 Tax=Salinisphaera sp. TaxID=1914330 RepID=UPI002D78B963|nr:ribosome biogenesis GTP-binding protein YihA/YsxC [Salinisphaera sp.]HET7315277.1 ribosome biogenesis GTP-binding protein YihA/YsxC [Salinisphaera sp.]